MRGMSSHEWSRYMHDELGLQQEPDEINAEVVRRMLDAARAAGDPPRSIITISSVNAFTVGLNRAEYCLSKTGLAMLSKLFAHRLADAGS